MIIAIDPGPVKSAFVVLNPRRRNGLITARGFVPNGDLVVALRDGMIDEQVFVPKKFPLAVEMIASFGMAVGAEVFETVYWIGRFVEAWSPGKAERVKRMEVKMHLCQNSRAKDANIRQALIDKLGPVGKPKEPGPCYGLSGDLWSALAVGITYLETR